VLSLIRQGNVDIRSSSNLNGKFAQVKAIEIIIGPKKKSFKSPISFIVWEDGSGVSGSKSVFL